MTPAVLTRRLAAGFAAMPFVAALSMSPTVLAVVIFVSGRARRGQPFDDLAWMSRPFALGTTVGLICGCAFWIIALHPGRAATPSLP